MCIIYFRLLLIRDVYENKYKIKPLICYYKYLFIIHPLYTYSVLTAKTMTTKIVRIITIFTLDVLPYRSYDRRSFSPHRRFRRPSSVAMNDPVRVNGQTTRVAVYGIVIILETLFCSLVFFPHSAVDFIMSSWYTIQ